MLEIFAYAIGIMYTPGPINLLGLHSGLNNKATQHLGFFIGVGSAMFTLFVFLAFVGLQVINLKYCRLLAWRDACISSISPTRWRALI